MKVLLEHGAQVNASGGYFGSALQAAAYVGSMEGVQLLLQKGAAVNARGGRYGSALQAAKAAGRAKIAEALVDAGAQELDWKNETISGDDSLEFRKVEAVRVRARPSR